MAAADSVLGNQGAAANVAQTTLRAEANEALRSVAAQGSGAIASTEVWARNEEACVRNALRQAHDEGKRKLAEAVAEIGREADARLRRLEPVGPSPAAMVELFEAERDHYKSAWDREKSELLRLLEKERAAREQERTRAQEQAAAEAAARGAEAELAAKRIADQTRADVEMVWRQELQRSQISNHERALAQERLSRELADLRGLVTARMS